MISDPDAGAGRPSGRAADLRVAELVTELAGVVVDDRGREAARLRLTDTLFATAVGNRTGQGRRSAGFADAFHGRDSVAGRAFRLGAACRMTEIDDVDLLSCITPGSIVVPTLLAVLTTPEGGRHHELDDVLDVVVRGYEVALGLGESIAGPWQLARGIWPSLAVGAVTAAAVTTLLLDGGRAEMEQAVDLASCQSLHGNPRGTAREQLFAGALVTGIGSAFAVRRGFVVAGGGDGGTLRRLLTVPVTASGSLRIHRPAIKGFCSARQTMTAVAALRQVAAGTPLSPAAIDRIDVHVPHEYAAMLDKPRVRTRRDSVSSAHYQLAIAACRPDALHDVGRSDLGTDELAPVMAAVHVHGSDELSTLYPQRWPARVGVVSGSATYEATAEIVPGEDDLSAAALTAKMRRFAAVTPALSALTATIGTLPDDAHDVAGVLDLVEALEDTGDDSRPNPVSSRSTVHASDEGAIA